MPDITLHIPENSRFSSSLNEIDMCMKEIFLTEMRLADPRDKSHKQVSRGSNSNWLWEPDRVFQVDEMTTEDVFDTWLLRYSQTNKNIDVTYPLLAYKQNDIDSVFWGTGNRYHQWEIEVPQEHIDLKIGDTVAIIGTTNVYLYGRRATIYDIAADGAGYFLKFVDTGKKVCDDKNKPIVFREQDLKSLMNITKPLVYKAKAMTCKYSAVILVDNRDEAQYIRDHFILRCNDANIWFRYNSPILNNTENQIYTVFEIPTLERYPSNTDRLKGKGYIYGVGVDVNVWATLTDEPVPSNIIEMIRLNIKEDSEKRFRKYIITP